MSENIPEQGTQSAAPRDDRKTRPYRKPTVKVMSESEVLASFQITSAFASWWW